MACYSKTVSTSLLFLFLLFGFSAAKELLVGGKIDAWKVPSSEADSLNRWAEKSRFNVGDHLVWKYDGGKDSVLQVNKEDYANCNISNPIEEYKDGNTKVKLDRSGPFYFISGAKGHCEKGQKLTVVVISPRRRYRGGVSPAPSPAVLDYSGVSPALSPAELEQGPAVAPTSGAPVLQTGLVMVMGLLAIYVGIFI
ncbi:early nodulin-like protein 1-like [Trifolium pratense]|uniref:Early nodulin-like protein 1-like n=1 Tax=Trifolium pratense TaxID=57577 RepID=A0A2K3MVC1_TRIPR|nr:early nodulin-like protein 1-like [Trifolium pratense]